MALRLSTIALLLVASPGLGAPGGLPQASCGYVIPADEYPPPVVRLVDRSALFVGTVLWESTETARPDTLPAESPRQTVTFLVEASWGEQLTDTTTLLVGSNSPTARYFAGTRYHVAADRDGSVLRTAHCDYAWPMDHPVARDRLSELGPASWSLETRTRPGFIVDYMQTPPDGPLAELNLSAVSGDRLIESAEIGGEFWTQDSGWIRSKLPVGVYRARLTLSDGSVVFRFLGVRCDPAHHGREWPEGSCVALRQMFALDEN